MILLANQLQLELTDERGEGRVGAAQAPLQDSRHN
jgi:hypothetical protein